MTEEQYTITLTAEDGWYTIHDEETGVTTRGASKGEALLMLADALAAAENTDDDLLGMAIDIFVPDLDDHAVVADHGSEDDDPPDVSEEQIHRQRAAALWLATSHRTIDCSDPHRFNILRGLIYGTTLGCTIAEVGALVEAGRWAVFDAIATGTRTVKEIAVQLDVTEEHVRDAVDTLIQSQFIAVSDDERLYAAQTIVSIAPYQIDDENVIDWETYNYKPLPRTLEEADFPTSLADTVVVERQGGGYSLYHDPEMYTPYWTAGVAMAREAAEKNEAHPCTSCFPDTPYAGSDPSIHTISEPSDEPDE